jgi:hypothetical protein
VAPAIWWLYAGALRRAAPKSSRILIVADPVYSGADPRRGREATPPTGVPAATDRPRLFWTAREAQSIARLFPAAAV